MVIYTPSHLTTWYDGSAIVIAAVTPNTANAPRLNAGSRKHRHSHTLVTGLSIRVRLLVPSLLQAA